MRKILLLFVYFILSKNCFSKTSDSIQYIITPFNLAFGVRKFHYNELNKQLTENGYHKISNISNDFNYTLSYYHKNNIVLSSKISWGGQRDSLYTNLKKMNYNYVFGNINIGYSIFHLKKLNTLMITPKLGVFWGRSKFICFEKFTKPNSHYEETNRKDILKWESGLDASIYAAWIPFKKNYVLQLFGLGFEGGFTYQNYYKTKSNIYENTFSPITNDGKLFQPYFNIHIDFLRGFLIKMNSNKPTITNTNFM